MPPPSRLTQGMFETVRVLERVIHDKRPLLKEQHTELGAVHWRVIKGTLRTVYLYTPCIVSFTKIKPKDNVLTLLIASSLYQIHHMDKASVSKIAFAAAEVSRLLKKSSAKKLVYAAIRTLSKLPPPSPDASNNWGLPLWLSESLNKQLPIDVFEQTAKNWLEPICSLHVRVVQKKMCNTAFETLMRQEGMTYEPLDHCPNGYRLYTNAQSLPLLKEKTLYVQNQVNQIIPTLLPKLPESSHVLDCCAAPGGKTGALLDKQPYLTVTVNDISTNKLALLKDNLSIYGNRILYTKHDFTKSPTEKYCSAFDAILVDAPCSALGAIGKHPEIKFLQSEDNIAVLRKAQERILNNAWRCLKGQGFLLFSTCTLSKQENQDLVSHFLETHHDAKIIPLAHPLATPKPYGLAFYPHKERHGAYACLLQKL